MYETLRRQKALLLPPPPPSDDVMTRSATSSGPSPPPIHMGVSIKGIRPRVGAESPPALPPPPAVVEGRDVYELYARVDRSKKRKGRSGNPER